MQLRHVLDDHVAGDRVDESQPPTRFVRGDEQATLDKLFSELCTDIGFDSGSGAQVVRVELRTDDRGDQKVVGQFDR